MLKYETTFHIYLYGKADRLPCRGKYGRELLFTPFCHICACDSQRNYKSCRGSFTVEAAALMPVIFLTLFGCLYLCFYVHNRAWLTAAAYEAAEVGSMETALPAGNVYEAADRRSKELGNIGFFGAENLCVQTSAAKEVEVTYTLDTIAAYAGFTWPLQVQGKVKLTEPVKWIRRIIAAADAVSDFGG